MPTENLWESKQHRRIPICVQPLRRLQRWASWNRQCGKTESLWEVTRIKGSPGSAWSFSEDTPLRTRRWESHIFTVLQTHLLPSFHLSSISLSAWFCILQRQQLLSKRGGIDSVDGGGCAGLCLSASQSDSCKGSREDKGKTRRRGWTLCGPLKEHTPSRAIKPEPGSENRRGYRGGGLVMIAAVPWDRHQEGWVRDCRLIPDTHLWLAVVQHGCTVLPQL